MQQITKLFERLFTWAIDHLPMPAGLRRTLSGRRDVVEEMAKFLFTGGVATLVFSVAFNGGWWILERAGVSAEILDKTCFLLGQFVAVLVAYFMSFKFVFTNDSGRKRFTEAVLFFGLAAVAIAWGMGALALFEAIVGHHLGQLEAFLVSAVAIVTSWGLRFFLARNFVFRAHLDRPAVSVVTELAHVSEEAHEGDSSGNEPAEPAGRQ